MLAAPAMQQQDCPRDYAADIGHSAASTATKCTLAHSTNSCLARIAVTHSQHVPYNWLSRSSKRRKSRSFAARTYIFFLSFSLSSSIFFLGAMSISARIIVF
jgi:hypothetical protein